MATSLEQTFDNARTELSFREILEFTPVGFLIFQTNWKIKFVKNFPKLSNTRSNIPLQPTVKRVHQCHP